MSGPFDASRDGGGRVNSKPGDTVLLTMAVLGRRAAATRCRFDWLGESSSGRYLC